MMLGHHWLRYAVAVCLFTAAASIPAADPNLLAEMPSNLRGRHPQAKALLQEVNLTGGEMSVRDFAKFLKSKFNLIVDLDERSLDEERVELETPLPVPLLKNITLLSAIHFFLDQVNCTFIEEPRRLVITTKTVGILFRPRALFYVQDLISTEPKFELEDLQDPILDHNEAVRLRISSKLQKLVSWQLNEASINDIVAKLRKDLDENVWVDAVKLEEESVKTDVGQFSCDYQDVPLGDILRWLLKSKNLVHFIRHEVIQITTITYGSIDKSLRAYPAQGLVFRDVQPNRSEFIAVTPQWNGPGLGWLGGYGSGYGMLGNQDPIDGIGPAAEVGGRYYRMRLSVAPGATNTKTTAPTDGPGTPSVPKAVDPFKPGGPHPLVSATDAHSLIQDNAYSLLDDILEHTGGRPNDMWIYGIDGEGGALSMYYPSLSIVVRQTDEAHAQIAQYLQEIRALQAKRGTNPTMVALTAKDVAARPDKAVLALIELLEELTGGNPDSPWTQDAGEGGTVTYDKAHFALTIRQTPRALDEIAGLLVQLRRHRYELFHGSRPWETGENVELKSAPLKDKTK